MGTVRILYRAGTISLQAAVYPKYKLGALNMKKEELVAKAHSSHLFIVNWTAPHPTPGRFHPTTTTVTRKKWISPGRTLPLYTSVVHIGVTVLLTRKLSQATTHFLSGLDVELSTHHHLAPRLMKRARLYLYSMDPLERMVKLTGPFPDKCI